MPEPEVSKSAGILPKTKPAEPQPISEPQPKLELQEEPEPQLKLEPQVKFEAPKPMPAPAKPTPPPPSKPIAARFDTNDLRTKKTSPTLVEFQTKKATVPEWRLQLQNSVRQKVGTNRRDAANTEGNQMPQATPRSTSGANALKVEYVEDEQQPSSHQNPRVANALKRIEESRRAFSNQPVAEQSLQTGKPAAPRNFPFNVVARSNEPAPRQAGQKATVNPSPKPMLVSPLKIEKKGFDTNKLPPLTKPAAPARTFIPAAEAPNARNASGALIVEENILENEAADIEVETDEIDDLAPISVRFSAGIFDVIVGVFAGLILLSPFILSGGSWLSLSGFFAIAAAVAIVMFLYLTISVAFVGRTLGMRLFSLELVDVEENAYPTLHQAAVNAAVFLLSLTFAGVGFIPMFFNEERRAAHDILSGTILIREY
ncbi:MAG: RDD family protein [Pyrinomonadaceae bacterium]